MPPWKSAPTLRGARAAASPARAFWGASRTSAFVSPRLLASAFRSSAGSVTAAFVAVSERSGDVAVEVECDTLEQVAEAVAAGAELILLDNFAVDQMARAVTATGGRARLEASGGLQLAWAGQVAATGVDFLAVGALTHSAPALDIGLDLVQAG